MDDVIDGAKIDAKHSNEDSIVTFDIWVKKYGDRIGNFGGIDVDALCRLPEAEMHTYIQNLINKCIGHGGFAFGTGNSVPDYVPVDQYLIMNKIVREIRDKIHGQYSMNSTPFVRTDPIYGMCLTIIFREIVFDSTKGD